MWHGIHGHDRVVERFRQTLKSGRLASTYLFVGPPGIGKRTFALKLAQALLCPAASETDLDPCGTCDVCIQITACTHPDLITISKPAGKNTIPVDLFIGDCDHRRQQGLCHDISLKPFAGGRKIAVIDDADDLSLESANALLKTLEEPPPRAVLILIGTSLQRQLPTIRSRAQIVRFAPLATDTLAKLLVEQQVIDDEQEARRLAKLAEGSLARATELAESELCEFRDRLIGNLSAAVLDSVRTAQMVSQFVDIGREAIDRRHRLRQVIGFAMQHYRQSMRTVAGAGGDPSREADRAERCLEALTHVDRYVNQATLIGSWFDDLAA